MGLLVGTKRALLPGYPATKYFVDATVGNDANDGKTPDLAWQTIGKVNGETFLPGNRILLIRDGEWRERLDLPSSGVAGKRIIFDAYGSGANPVINGADIITGWVDYGAGAGSTWQSALATEPNQVFMDDTRLTEGADEDNLNDHEWFWVGNVLYVRDDTGDPDGSVVIEASVRSYNIDFDGHDYVSIANINCKYANTSGILIDDGGTGFVLRNLDVSYAYVTGINIYASSVQVSAGLIDLCTASYSQTAQGIFVGDDNMPGPGGVAIQNCITHNNGDHGIYFGRGTGNTVRRNVSYNNTNGGLKFNSILSCTASRNYFYDNLYGIIMRAENGDACSGNLIKNNIIYSNSHSGVIFTDDGNAMSNNLFYHNHFVNNSHGTTNAGAYFATAGTVTGTIFKNNIFYNDENLGANGWLVRFADAATRTNQTFDYNIYYWLDRTPASGIISDGVARTFAAWQGLGQDANGDEDNPDFVTNYTDLHLLVGSPCRGAGAIDTGVTRDYDGVARPDPPTQPDIGAYQWI